MFFSYEAVWDALHPPPKFYYGTLQICVKIERIMHRAPTDTHCIDSITDLLDLRYYISGLISRRLSVSFCWCFQSKWHAWVHFPPNTTAFIIITVQLLSCVWLPLSAAHQASLSFTVSQNLLKLMSIESMMPSNHLILFCPLLLPPSIFPSIRVFSNESALCTRWPNYWSFSFSINPSNEYSQLISYRIDWLDLLAIQGTLKSLLQPHSSKASVLWLSAFFTVQLLYPSVTTGKTIPLTTCTFCQQSTVSAF